jgi:adenylate kinase family enzyme
MKIMSTDEQLKRVVIIGTSCAGKTTLASNLAQRLGVRHIELDSIHWQSNWTPTPKEEFRSAVATAATEETWVADGNYSAVRDVLWARATTLVWLNYPFYVVGRRALSRTFRNVFYRKVLWSGNRETFRQSFLSRDSVLWWVVKTYRRRRREYPRLFDDPRYRHLRVIELASPAEAERFLQSIDRKPPAENGF